MQLYLCLCWQHSSCYASGACSFIVIISAQVWCCQVSSIVAALPLIMTAPFSVWPKKSSVQWSGFCGRKVYPQRLSAQYGNNVLPQRSVYEWIEKLNNGRTNVTHDKGAGRPSTAITEDNIERARDMVLLDDWLLTKWHMFCKLAMVRPTKWCTTNLGFIESVQDGSQNNSQRCRNKRA